MPCKILAYFVPQTVINGIFVVKKVVRKENYICQDEVTT